MPHPPPDPDWPEHVKAIYARGCARIDELREQIGPDGIIPIPFRCYGCDGTRSDLALVNGDGLPVCGGCIDRIAAALGDGPQIAQIPF